MPSLKPIKSFAHNLADSYLSTLGWVEDDYKSTWLYRAALESNVNRIELDILQNQVRPVGVKHRSVLLRSLGGLEEQFVEMLVSQGIPKEEVVSLVFYCEFPSLSKEKVSILCTSVAVDRSGKEHRGAPVSSEYGYAILAT